MCQGLCFAIVAVSHAGGLFGSSCMCPRPRACGRYICFGCCALHSLGGPRAHKPTPEGGVGRVNVVPECPRRIHHAPHAPVCLPVLGEPFPSVGVNFFFRSIFTSGAGPFRIGRFGTLGSLETAFRDLAALSNLYFSESSRADDSTHIRVFRSASNW